MEIKFEEKAYILDGAMGTMLQRIMGEEENAIKFGLDNPEALKSIHREYIAAGSDIIYAATFEANKFKLEDLNYSVEEAVNIAMGAASDAVKASGKNDVKIALGMGPLGVLLEPMGSLPFEEAYECFKSVVLAGKNRADLAVIETMTDLYEVKAAVLAVKENSNLPVIVSMTFEEDGRTFTGVSLESMAVTLEGLGVDAMGINCSLGPVEILPMIKKLRELTSIPVFAKPNAGMPDPATGTYDITCDMFTDTMKKYLELGICMVGGCCGTDPDYIRGLNRYRDSYSTYNKEHSSRAMKLCSGSRVVEVDHVTVIGERINPTGKKLLKQALLDEDMEYIRTQAIEQIDAGAELLDVNVGVPGIDDVSLLPKVIKTLQAITDVPLQIDSSNPEAIEAALRVYNGKAIVNSVNGEEEVMKKILPIVKKYGAAVIGLTLDDKGIPATADGRVEIAERIVSRAEEYGIPPENIIIDCLTLTVSAQQKEAAHTLQALKNVKEKLGVKTALGVSNISFGLPVREYINRTFLVMAMEAGLDLPIINPNDADMMASIHAFHVLRGYDVNGERYITEYGNTVKEIKSADTADRDIFYCIKKGLREDTAKAVSGLLKDNAELEIVDKYLIPALHEVGQGFEKGTIFLPQMLQAAGAAQAGFEVIKSRLLEKGEKSVSHGQVVLATVKGDIHDIGKNIVKVIMENYGYTIIDLGRDVPIEKIVETVKEKNIKLVGLSALMTTTLKNMENTILEINKVASDCKVMVGGAVLTENYAKTIGADYYCKDAMKSVEAAQEVFDE